VGVAVPAAGPGVTNGVTGAQVAYDNCFPLVILGGSGPQRARYTGTFQETENIPMFKGITKMAVLLDSTAHLLEYLAMAFKARTGRPGPVYLDLPSYVLQNAVEEERVRWPASYYTQVRPLGDQIRSSGLRSCCSPPSDP
jgi:thiamine pyrophosphate-dependent acetolactate synthase large subunit-like protein